MEKYIYDVGLEPNARRKFGRDFNRFSWQDPADGAIPAYGLVKVNPTDGKTLAATADSLNVVGANAENVAVANTGKVQIVRGLCSLKSASPILAGSRIKAAAAGTATQLIDADTVGTLIKTSSAGSAFTNQPANDSLTIVSSSAADATGEGEADKTVTIIGTTNGGVVVVLETIVLTGVTPVVTTKADWGLVLAVKKTATTGTITITETSGGLTVTTLTPSATSKGVDTVAAASQGAFNGIPSVTCSSTGTKVVGIQYLAADGVTTAYQAVAQNGASAVAYATAALLVTEVYTGDVEAARTSAIKVTATAEDAARCCGKAYTAATTAGATFTGIVN
jgi:hypothetical protein